MSSWGRAQDALRYLWEYDDTGYDGPKDGPAKAAGLTFDAWSALIDPIIEAVAPNFTTTRPVDPSPDPLRAWLEAQHEDALTMRDRRRVIGAGSTQDERAEARHDGAAEAFRRTLSWLAEHPVGDPPDDDMPMIDEPVTEFYEVCYGIPEGTFKCGMCFDNGRMLVWGTWAELARHFTKDHVLGPVAAAEVGVPDRRFTVTLIDGSTLEVTEAQYLTAAASLPTETDR